MSYIEFDNVKKIYKMGDVKIKALNGASFSIDKGEFAVIAGQVEQVKVLSLTLWVVWIWLPQVR